MKQEVLLSKNGTKSIKGFLVCMVLLSHLHARVSLFSNSLVGTIFSAFGYLAVSSFFFLSAFGLYESCLQKGKNYVIHFPAQKLLPYYAMCCVAILIYLVRDLVVTGTTHWPTFAWSFFFGKTVVDMGWYLQAQLLLYIIFFVVFRFAKKQRLLLVGLMLAVYCAICAVVGLSETWYESVLCFLLGMLCAKYQKQILMFYQDWKQWLVAGAGIGVLFIITLFLGNKTILPNSLRICVKMVSAIAFNGLVVSIVARLNLENPVTGFLGKYSFEIYVLQGIFLYGYRSVIKNDWFYMGAVVASVILLSLAAHPLFTFVSKTISSLCTKTQRGRK